MLLSPESHRNTLQKVLNAVWMRNGKRSIVPLVSRSARKMEQQVTVKAAVTRNLQRKAVSLDFELIRTNEFP